MNIVLRSLIGSRAAALASLFLVFAGALRAEEKTKPEVPPSILKKYDKDKSGALDETEIAKWEADKAARREKDRLAREERLAKYDTDKDGKLSDDEKAAAKLEMDKERADRDMVKGKEKAQERLAREKAEKQSEADATTEKTAPADAKTKDGEKPVDGMMME